MYHPFRADSEADQGGAIGWISIAELFLLVGALLLASSVLSQFRLDEARAENARLRIDEKHLRRDLEQLVAENESLRGRIREQARLLAESSGYAEKIRNLLDQVSDLSQQLTRLRDELAGLQARLAETEAERDRLWEENAALRMEFERLRERYKAALASRREAEEIVEDLEGKVRALENRFEGLRLDGRKVIFLVDRSGSMGSIDPGTPEPEKWPTVCDTVSRVMLSLPDLEQYQLIVFSDKVSFLGGNEGEWLEFEGQQTVDAVVPQLKSVVPEGNTDLYAGLEAAFRYRPLGLEAIYLFSDGLPNIGPGLAEEDMVLINEVKKRDAKRAESIKIEVIASYLRAMVRDQWNQGGSVRIESVGFFYESPDLGAFLWGLSRENGGSFVGMSNP